ncbi:MAG: sulfite exporter TauE/SafE family protein [Pirellulaceae bacterium]|nr:sulfite exporter TauE/SafE family protein [Pirellulaceae bacterium]
MWVWVGAAIIGLTMGLFGSGGSILTVPLLVYLLGHSPKLAIAESLLIVGLIAIVSSIRQHSKISWLHVWQFGLVSMLGAFLGAWLSQFVVASVQLMTFAGLLLLASALMFRNGEDRDDSGVGTAKLAGSAAILLGLQGLLVGVMTGFVGVGGGFLIIPALTIFAKVPMNRAVATSLVIIVMNSVVGFSKHWVVLSALQKEVNWLTIGVLVFVGIAGSLVGESVQRHLNERHMRRAFAVFLILIGMFVLMQEVPKMSAGSGGRDSTPTATAG